MITTKSGYGSQLKGKLKQGLLLLVAVIFSSSIYAQEKTVTGKVTSSTDGIGLPSVNVVIKGTDKGVSSDFDGNFSIQASSSDVLVFKFLGFKEQEIAVGNQTYIEAQLVEDVSNLEEVVVVGYGTKKKSDLTGSVSVVDVDDAKKTVTYDVAKMLQGQAPGVLVRSSGEPGGFVDIKIRGITSFRNNNPLFVIDGVIVEDPYDFPTGDIESMQVLKDASSAAIYGARGANGVVIITTKKGREGKIDIKYKSLFGVQSVPENRWYSLTNREQYQQITSQAELNDGLAIVPGNDPNSEFFIDDVDTDWQDAAFKTGTVTNHSLTFNGGSKILNYNFNVDYFKNTAYINTPQDYERYSTNVNLGGQKGKFTYGAKLAFTQSDKQAFNEYLPGTSSIVHLVQAIPTMPVYDPNRLGGYGGADNATQRAITLNIIGFNNLIENENVRNRFIGNVWGEYEIIKGLKYKINVSADKLNAKARYYNPPSDLGWYYENTTAEARLDVNSLHTTRTIVNNLLTYNTTIAEKHKVDVLLGHLQERNDVYNQHSSGQGYEVGAIPSIQYAETIGGDEYRSAETYKSLISRLNYTFDDKYLLTVNFRQDKSSKFAPKNNTGNYFSVSAGWKLHEEDFINLPDWLNTTKLRAGYGQLGNNTIGLYEFALAMNAFSGYPFGNSYGSGSTVVSIVDPDIKWEDTETTNAAIELGMFNNSLNFTAEYFTRKSTDLLADVPIPYSSGGFPLALTTNAGNVKNSGLEFTLGYNKYDGDFTYSISANLGTLKNEVESIGTNDTPISEGVSRTEVGRSIAELYVYETEGIFQNQAEIDAHALQPNAKPGDVKFRDVNGDGFINDDDRTFQGQTLPKINYGLNFSCNYKNFDLSMFFQGAAGHKIFNGTYQSLMIENYTNHHTDALNYWTPDNTDTNIPRPTISDPNANSRASDRFIEKGDYVRLQSLELGYNIPLGETKIINRARVYASGQNLLLLTGYSGYDPDYTTGSLFNRGFEFGSFPNPTTLALGVQIDF